MRARETAVGRDKESRERISCVGERENERRKRASVAVTERARTVTESP
jgi:hypothetical protein